MIRTTLGVIALVGLLGACDTMTDTRREPGRDEASQKKADEAKIKKANEQLNPKGP